MCLFAIPQETITIRDCDEFDKDRSYACCIKILYSACVVRPIACKVCKKQLSFLTLNDSRCHGSQPTFTIPSSG